MFMLEATFWMVGRMFTFLSSAFGFLFPDTDLPINPVTLRFHNRQVESGFLRGRKASLCSNSKTICLVAMLMDALALLFVVAVGRWHERETHSSEAAYSLHLVTLMCGAALLPMFLFFLVAVSSRCISERLHPVMIEAATTLVMIITLVVTVLSSPASVAGLQGRLAVLEYYSDSGALLTIDGIITAAHLGLRVRWFVLFPLEVVGIATYGVLILIGSAEPSALINMIFLSGLVTLAAVGKRYAELAERHTFLDILQEKSMRCEAEFRLSQSDGQRERQEPRPVDTYSESVPETTRSSVFLNHLSDGGTITDKLSRLLQIARSEHWRIKAGEVRFMSRHVLGRGAFGTVVEAIMSGIIVAVKISNQHMDDNTTAQELSDVCNEIRIFRHLRHPSIVAFHGAIIDPESQKIALVLERIHGTVLDSFVLRGGQGSDTSGPNTTERYQILFGICSALLYMHSRQPPIVHSDLKSTNVMVEALGRDVRPKLLDFGLSRVLSREQKPLGGTRSWMAPEVLHDSGPLRCSADVFSYGHMITFVATGMPPPRVKQGRHEARAAQPVPPWPPGCVFAPTCGPLTAECLKHGEAERPSMAEVQQRLLEAADKLDLAETGGGFLGDLRRVAEEVLRSASEEATDAAAPVEPEDAPDSREQELARPEAQLPSLPEAEVLSAGVPTGSRPESEAPLPRWRPLPLRPCTEREVMMATMLALISRWNYEQRRRPCCELHAGVKLAQEVCFELASRGCYKHSLPHGTTQCRRCGLLGVDGPNRTCDLCGEEGSVLQSANLSSLRLSSAARMAL